MDLYLTKVLNKRAMLNVGSSHETDEGFDGFKTTKGRTTLIPHNNTAINLNIRNSKQSLLNRYGELTQSAKLTGLTAKQRKKLKRMEWKQFIAFMKENPESLLDLTAKVP